MAHLRKSVKTSSDNSKNSKLNPASEKTNMKKSNPGSEKLKKIKVHPSKQPKINSALDGNAKIMEDSDDPEKDNLILQYSIDSTESEDNSSSMKIYFPCQFSMLQNMEFLDHISDAENIIFDNSVYAICKDVTTAEEIRVSANGLRFQGGKNSILRAERLGPAFCSFKRKQVDPTVLTIKKLPPGLSYQDLLCRFPGALDISLKKTMAKLKFADADHCKQAWLCARDIVWPQGAVPRVDPLPKDCDSLEAEEKVDPDELKFGHPCKFVEDPCVLFLLLKKKFELTKGMEVLDVLKTATDIILSKSCTVVFPTYKEALKRRQLLAGHRVAGGDVVTWMLPQQHSLKNNKPHKREKKTLVNTEVDSDGADEEELEMAPPAKKMKKGSAQ